MLLIVFRMPKLFEVTYCLAQRSALSNGDLISLLYTKCGRNMSSQILVSLLISGVFGNEMEVFAADDESSMHFGRDNGAGKYSTTDRDLTSKWTFLIYNGFQSVVHNMDNQCMLVLGREDQVPIYVPSMAVFGVLKPRPTSLYHLRPPFPTLVLFVLLVF